MDSLKKTILIDLDGVLNNYIGKFDKDFIPSIKEGAKEFLENLSKNFIIKIFLVASQPVINSSLQSGLSKMILINL